MQRGILRREAIEEQPVQPHQAVARGQVGEAEAEAQGRASAAVTASITASAHLAQQGEHLDPLLGGQRRQRRVMRPLRACHGTG